MTHEMRLRSRLAEQRLLERQHYRKPIHVVRHLLHPALVPGPHLRRDEIQNRDTLRLAELGKAQVEAGIIDWDDEVGSFRSDAVLHIAPEPGKEREVLEDF